MTGGPTLSGGISCAADGRVLVDGFPIIDGDVWEIETDQGWVCGHLCDRLHPETGEIAFELHLSAPVAGDAREHRVIYLPSSTRIRRQSNRAGV